MRHLVIGIPARDEAATVVALADALEAGTVRLGETTAVELVLAYQDSDDATLELFLARRHRLPQRVLRCPPGTTGKGRNLKLLVDHAAELGAGLLLVDGDMRNLAPVDLARFVTGGAGPPADLVLPLWCRAWGHANVTNFFAVPLLHALYGARLRQPLAGQRLIGDTWVRRLASVALPDDYGIDVALTMAVLDGGGRVDQVVVPRVDHDDRQLNSETIMVEVARALFGRVATGAMPDRADVVLDDAHLAELSWPDEETPGWRGAPQGHGSDERRAWLDALTNAVVVVRSGGDEAAIVDGLMQPFLEHAAARASVARPTVADADAYVWGLGAELAARLR